MITYKPGDRVRWESSQQSGVYLGTVRYLTPKGLIRVLFDEREGCPRDGKPIMERTLAPGWVEAWTN